MVEVEVSQRKNNNNPNIVSIEAILAISTCKKACYGLLVEHLTPL
jgi:hypothetical protein